MLTSILLIFSSGLLALYFYLKYNANYFKRKGVPFIPSNILIGNIADLALNRADPTEMVNKWYKHPAGKNLPYVGMRIFNTNIILVKDPELVKQVLIKDFNKFSDRQSTADSKNDSLAASNLFFIKNPEWRMIRNKLTPAFSSGKIKQMFPLIDAVSFIFAFLRPFKILFSKAQFPDFRYCADKICDRYLCFANAIVPSIYR